jgi:hypothetical protein
MVGKAGKKGVGTPLRSGRCPGIDNLQQVARKHNHLDRFDGIDRHVAMAVRVLKYLFI